MTVAAGAGHALEACRRHAEIERLVEISKARVARRQLLDLVGPAQRLAIAEHGNSTGRTTGQDQCFTQLGHRSSIMMSTMCPFCVFVVDESSKAAIGDFCAFGHTDPFPSLSLADGPDLLTIRNSYHAKIT
jgi:hypothetical protein